MASLKAVIVDVLAKLAALPVTNGDGATVTAYARVWNNQVTSDEDGKAYDYPKPAFFVELATPVQLEAVGGGFLSADLGVIIHIVHEYYNQDGTFEQDLVVFDLRDQVLAALSLYEPTACGPLVLASEEQDYNHTNLYHYKLAFMCHFIESKGSAYDPAAGKYIDKTPPTDLDLQVTTGTAPVFDPTKQNYRIPPNP